MRDSDELSVQEIPYFYPDSKGDNIVWDFSGIADEGMDYKVLLQKDTLGRNVGLGNDGVTYYRFNTDTLFLVCHENPLWRIYYMHPILALKYPLSYGDSISAPFLGYGIYCGDHPFKETGLSTVIADANGSIVIDDDTIPDVLRIHSLKSYSICMGIDSTLLDNARQKQVVEERYDWYAHGYRYPLFTTVSNTSYDDMQVVGIQRKAYCMSPDVQGLLIGQYDSNIRKSDSSANTTSQGGIQDVIQYGITQNDSKLTIYYTLDDTADITAIVSDTSGIVHRKAYQHGESGNGYSITINCTGLRHGKYILYINVNGKVYSEKVTM